MIKTSSLFILFLCVSALHAQTKKGDVLIKNGTVITITDGTLENTDVLVRNGKIDRIGKNLKAPNGVEEVDAT